MIILKTLPRLAVPIITVVSAQLGLSDGLISFHTPSFTVQLVKDSQTLYSLIPKSSTFKPQFDFIPSDVMSQRQANGNYHIGDITYRVRMVGSTAWISGDSSTARTKVTAITVADTNETTNLAAANLAPTLPSGSPLNITRRWALTSDGQLELLFDVSNPSTTTSVEIGALGVPLEFNNIFTGRTAANTNINCSLYDPYIGQDAGYVQVTPLLGTLPPLVVLPVGKSPLEGWRFLPEDTSTALAYQSQTYEANYEWDFHTLAYAQNEWSAVTPWNNATSFVLAAGQTRPYGLQFRLAPSIRTIEDTVRAAGHPVAVGIPGYIVAQDQKPNLFLNYSSAVSSISVSPPGALTWTALTSGLNAGLAGYSITPIIWGRSRLSIIYADGTLQTVHYYVTKASSQTISDLGNFLTTSQWFANSTDPFHRSPSVISYDRQVNAPVLNDARAWIPGLSDEAGAGSWLAASMKQFAQPSAAEVAKIEQFINQTLWGSVQNNPAGTVKMSVYFYQPPLVPGYVYPSTIDWGNWWSWNQSSSYGIGRGYDYVHVTAAYWALYRVARNYPGLTTTHTWQWYLDQAVFTVLTMTNGQVGYTDDGLMGETVIKFLLDDLKREGLMANATAVQARMQARHAIWTSEQFPYGSEMAWDSTGEEGVYVWSVFFNDTTTATNSLNAVLAYQPTIAHWGYNGNARRYWDNVYGGKLQRIERQIHHYGSGLNALPVIQAFEANPTDYYLLRVGFGGLSGPLSNIDQGGFASASFHSFEDTLMWDYYSGDYGPNFSGHSMGIATFIIDHPHYGWQAFGGNVLSISTTDVQVAPLDSLRKRVFIAPLGTMFTLDAGTFSLVNFNPTAKSVTLTIVPKPRTISDAAAAPQGRLLITQTAAVSGVGTLKPTTKLAIDAGAFVIPFMNGVGTITIQ